MDNKEFSPEQSFELITRVIGEARNRFEESGFIYVFWGILITVASLSQFVLLKNELYNINWYPYLLMPVGAIITGVYYSKKRRKKIRNQVTNIVSVSWITVSFNIMILGFVFAMQLKQNLVPVILILLSVGILISAGTIKSKLLYYSGFTVNISAFICFYLDWIYHSLLMGIIAIFAILIPGILLTIKNKDNKNV
jgi:uncharacterized membrane protein